VSGVRPPGSHTSSSSTLTTYDQVPYRSVALPQTHPDRLATIARIFGLVAPDVDRCRVLELGCASGGNLLPMAYNLPGATFVGLDLSRRQVEDGRATIRAMGLGNARIEHASILDVDSRWGEFDYIICHGVFSWVDPPVQDRILAIARDNLSPTGVAYISYNTYPGWHMREMVRHMMLYHTRGFEEPQEQLQQARALLSFLASASAGLGPYGDLLTLEVDRLGKVSDSYLFHEHLEPDNAPIYFHQFMDRAERAGLLYLSEAAISEMIASHLPAPVAQTLERISPDILHLEQYMDFVKNRTFRQTLLCHAGRKPQRALTPALLQGLLASSPVRPDAPPIDLAANHPAIFWKGQQRLDVTLTATKAALTLLAERWPEAMAVDEVCAAALDRAAPFQSSESREHAHRSLLSDLFSCSMHGVVQLHTRPVPCTSTPGDRPRGHAFAAYLAERGSVIVNGHHDAVELDPLSRIVLQLANGSRSRADIVEALVAAHRDGVLTLEQHGQAVTSTDAARAVVAERLDRVLVFLTRSAVLVPGEVEPRARTALKSIFPPSAPRE
jgi:methyltransferase-like protein